MSLIASTAFSTVSLTGLDQAPIEMFNPSNTFDSQGLTRLTDSGLSMVDWRPLLGTIPPLNQNQWLRVFNDYQLTPEFIS